MSGLGSSVTGLFSGALRARTERPTERELLAELAAAKEDLARAHLELRVEKLRADEADSVKSRFLAVVSHELRTPLNAIIGYNELLLEVLSGDEERECALEVRRGAVDLRNLVDAILEFSGIESWTAAPDEFPFPPAVLLAQAADMIADAAAAKGLTIRTAVEPGTPLEVVADPSWLHRVLKILAGNAVKFTERGEVWMRVSSPAVDRLRFEVEDTGVGVPASMREKLFRPFTQADGSSTRKFGGMGLGLVTARRIVEKMSGSIGLEDRPSGGSIFWFEVPARFSAD